LCAGREVTASIEARPGAKTVAREPSNAKVTDGGDASRYGNNSVAAMKGSLTFAVNTRQGAGSIRAYRFEYHPLRGFSCPTSSRASENAAEPTDQSRRLPCS
jgi:hypothetical protein